MKEIKLRLTDEEVENLLLLIQNSSDTDNEEWDETILSIERKLLDQLYK